MFKSLDPYPCPSYESGWFLLLLGVRTTKDRMWSFVTSLFFLTDLVTCSLCRYLSWAKPIVLWFLLIVYIVDGTRARCGRLVSVVVRDIHDYIGDIHTGNINQWLPTNFMMLYDWGFYEFTSRVVCWIFIDLFT